MRNRVISQLDNEQVTDILEEMEPDEAADVLSDLPEEKAQELLDMMDQEDAEDIQELLEHEEDTAGGLMNTGLPGLPRDITDRDALEQIRLLAPMMSKPSITAISSTSDDQPGGVVTLKDC